MDRIRVHTNISQSITTSVKFGDNGSCAVDQTPSKEFNINPMTGRPISDITTILRAKDADAERLLKSLPEYKSTFLDANVSDEQALMYYQPRLCQLPSELAELSEHYTKMKMDETIKQRKLAEQKKLFEEIDKNKVSPDDKEGKEDDDKKSKN